MIPPTSTHTSSPGQGVIRTLQGVSVVGGGNFANRHVWNPDTLGPLLSQGAPTSVTTPGLGGTGPGHYRASVDMTVPERDYGFALHFHTEQ